MSRLTSAAIANVIAPKVVISLDFELRWGVHDLYGLDFDAYRDNLEGVRRGVPALLKLFSEYNIRATWAAVGGIGCRDWDEYFRRAPPPPKYATPALAVKPEYADLDPNGDLHFAPDLMESITKTAGQELGTHTFSHLYLREKGVAATDLAADLAAVSALYRERHGTVPRSLVFPRNQNAFIDVVRASTVRIWRGNQARWYYEREDTQRNGIVPRTLKLLEELNPLCRHAAPVEGDMTRASLFLRLALPARLWAAHVQRIKGELRSIRPGNVFHVWFHPHNLGRDTGQRLTRVEQIAALIAERQQRGQVLSQSMGDLI